MSDSRGTRARPYVLAAALGLALALAAGLPVGAVAPLTGITPEGVRQSLTVESDGGRAAVRYRENGVEVLSALAGAAEDRLEVHGTIAGRPYAWTSRMEGEGILHVSAALGDDAFAGTLVTGQEGLPDARAFVAFRERVAGTEAGRIARRMGALLASSRSSDGTGAVGAEAAFAALAAHGAGDLAAGTDSLFEYDRCVRNSCRSCGGCWRDDVAIADCYFCPNASLSDRIWTAICYAVEIQMCFHKHILKGIQLPY